MAIEDKNKVLSFIKLRGPVLPVDVSKYIEKSTLITSAILADLKASGLLELSNMKVGGSPLYYVRGQESKLMNYIRFLNQKDQRTVLMLKEKKVVRDKDLDPLTKVSISKIKDFAKPLDYKRLINGKEVKERWWRFYLVPENKARDIIERYYNKSNESKTKKSEVKTIDKDKEKEKSNKKEESKNTEKGNKTKEMKEERPQRFHNMHDKVIKVSENLKSMINEEVKETKESKLKMDQGMVRGKVKDIVRINNRITKVYVDEKIFNCLFDEKIDISTLVSLLSELKIEIESTNSVKKNDIELVGHYITDILKIKVYIRFKNKHRISDKEISLDMLNASKHNTSITIIILPKTVPEKIMEFIKTLTGVFILLIDTEHK